MTINLDTKKLLGFRIAGKTDAKVGVKLGNKVGTKLGVKLS